MRANFYSRVRLDRSKKTVCGEEQLARRQYRPAAVSTQHAIARLRVLPELLDRRLQVVMHNQRCIRRQVVGQDRGVVEEQRQVVFDPGGADAIAHGLLKSRTRPIAFETRAGIAAKRGLVLLVEPEFSRGPKAPFAGLVDGAL